MNNISEDIALYFRPGGENLVDMIYDMYCHCDRATFQTVERTFGSPEEFELSYVMRGTSSRMLSIFMANDNVEPKHRLMSVMNNRAEPKEQ